MPSGVMIMAHMAEMAIFVIVFGACSFALGMIPDVMATFIEELRNLQDNFSVTRGPIHGIQTDSAQVWLVVGGGVMMIVGLSVLVLS